SRRCERTVRSCRRPPHTSATRRTRPTPAPSLDVRRAAGHVKSIGRIDKLFSGSRSRGVLADQPVDVVGVEFVPEGSTEPVVAVDLIDRGSVQGLTEHSAVTLRYEA